MMNKIFIGSMGFAVALLASGQAGAWSRGNAFGGSTSHSWGSTSHSNSWGGSTSHEAGEGTSHTNMYGGSATHYAGGGWSKTGAYGGTVSGYGHPYYPYHPPTTVNYYSAAGCYGCAAGAAVVGMAAGAAVASANTAAATTNAYNAGVAAASAAYAMGANYAVLPSGCMQNYVQGGTYYLCGNTWFQPAYGANGVFYRVVPTP